MFLCCALNNVNAQIQENEQLQDSVSVEIEKPENIHLARKATMYSAVLPGLGQIYNKQWWKVPFVYGGFAAIGYFINDRNNNFKSKVQGYRDLFDGDPATTSYYESLFKYNTGQINELTDASSYQSAAENLIVKAGKDRDMLIIGAIGFYLLNILDANVNAHFIDFDITEDLSLNIEPVGFDIYTGIPVTGLTFAYKF